MSEGNQDNSKNELDLENVFRQTYFISQGDSGLQRQLYQWLRVMNIFKYSDFPNDEPDWIGKFHAPKLHANSGQDASMNEDQKYEWANFKVEFYKAGSPKDEFLLTDILGNCLKRDLYYQIKARPNREDGQKSKADSSKDPHKSFVRHYILDGNLKSQPFSSLFDSLRTVLFSITPAEEELARIHIPSPSDSSDSVANWTNGALRLNQKLGMLIKLWEQNHPGEKFFPPSPTTTSS